jgi:Arc/MetJ family transcription regulator
VKEVLAYFRINNPAMQTTINLNDDLLGTAMRLSKATTSEEVMQQALENFVRLLQRRQLLALQGQVIWDGNLSEMRTVNNPDEWDQ